MERGSNDNDLPPDIRARIFKTLGFAGFDMDFFHYLASLAFLKIEKVNYVKGGVAGIVTTTEGKFTIKVEKV